MFRGEPGDLSSTIGISWDFIGISLGFHGDFMGFHGISLGFHGIYWDFMGFHGISWDFIGISWDFMGFHWDFMVISWWFHGISWDKNWDLDLAISDWISWGYNSGYSETRPGKLTQKTIEHGPVEIVDLSIKNGDLTPTYPNKWPIYSWFTHKTWWIFP